MVFEDFSLQLVTPLFGFASLVVLALTALFLRLVIPLLVLASLVTFVLAALFLRFVALLFALASLVVLALTAFFLRLVSPLFAFTFPVTLALTVLPTALLVVSRRFVPPVVLVVSTCRSGAGESDRSEAHCPRSSENTSAVAGFLIFRHFRSRAGFRPLEATSETSINRRNCYNR